MGSKGAGHVNSPLLFFSSSSSHLTSKNKLQFLTQYLFINPTEQIRLVHRQLLKALITMS